MTLIPYDSFKHFESFRKDIDELFQSFPGSLNHSSFGHVRIDVRETDNEVIAICDLPGLTERDQLQIDVKDNMLHISGQLDMSNEETDEYGRSRKSRYIRRFQRSISLPSYVSQSESTASYENGVLEIKMPKVALQQHPTRVNIDYR